MISSILLAAGLSTRMGRPKPLLNWGGTPLIRYQVEQLTVAGVDEVIVVLGHRADEIHRAIRDLRVRVMFNPRYQFGRAGSLRLGAKAANRDAERIVVLNVDQPRPAGLIRELLNAHDTELAATVPTSGGRWGHPVVVSGWVRPELLAADDESQGLRGILARHAQEVREYATSELCLLDINTPEEYEEALRQFALAR